MLDKTLPHIGVIMTKSDSKYPQYKLPDGYEFVMYKQGFEINWAEVESSVGEFDSTEQALEYFQKEFLNNEYDLSKRCIFIKSPIGKIVATTSVWPGNHFYKTYERVHWVCVHPDHQGKGLAKAILSKALNLYNSMENEEQIYLCSQTGSYRAINIYMKFGFVPYKGRKPVNWRCQTIWEQDIKNAWDIINNKISEYQSR